jgi:hypothetical protein
MIAAILMLGVATAPPGVGDAEQSRRTLLPEAMVLGAVDGKVVHEDVNDAWFFELLADVNDPNVYVPAGTRLPLLPSAVLERLIADVNDRSVPRYRLSARVTQYRGGNFLLPTYYLPLSKLKDAQSPGPADEAEQASEPAVASGEQLDPNLPIPEEVIKKFESRRFIRGPQREHTGTTPRQALSRVLVGRVGVIEQQHGRLVFLPYELGWNVGDVCYELLPCSALELALQEQRELLEPPRFNVAGLVTEFKGRKFLLLQRAAPVYKYGNFSR